MTYTLYDYKTHKKLGSQISLRTYRTVKDARDEALKLLKEDVKYSGWKKASGTKIAILRGNEIYADVWCVADHHKGTYRYSTG